MNPLDHQFGTATVLEILWTAAAVAGVVLTMAMIRYAYGDLQALKRVNNFRRGGIRHILARNHLRNQSIRFYLLAYVLLVGGLAMTTPNAPHPTLIGQVLGYGALSVVILTMWGSVEDYRSRQEMDRQELEQIDREHTHLVQAERHAQKEN